MPPDLAISLSNLAPCSPISQVRYLKWRNHVQILSIGTRGSDKRWDFSQSGANPTIRPLCLENHPLVTRNYSCPTVSLDALAVHVARWVGAGARRAVIYASPGSGKTHAIRCVSQQLAGQMLDVAWMKLQGHATEISGDCLDPMTLCLVDHEPATAIIPYTKSYSLEDRIQGFVNRTGQRTIVLWIDDSHLLDAVTDDSLRRLQDKLGEVDTRLICLLVGHPAARGLNEKRVSFTEDIRRIVPAVDAEEFELRGMLSPNDIEYCLTAFDNNCFPSGSDWPYTRFFLPIAYLAGLRLAASARTLWDIYVGEGRDRVAGPRIEVPIICLLRAIERALLDGAVQDSASFTIGREAWRTAVLRSGWV